MDTQLKDALDQTLSALERLLRLFRLERVLHLAAGLIAFVMLIAAIVMLVRQKGVDTVMLVSLFGSSGLIAVSSARITYFFNKAFRLVEEVVHALLRTGGE